MATLDITGTYGSTIDSTLTSASTIEPLPDTAAAPGNTFTGQDNPGSLFEYWSDPGNWSARQVPSNGASITLASGGIDDLASLSLSSISAGENEPDIVGSLLAVGTISVFSDGGLDAFSNFEGELRPVSVVIGSVAGVGGEFQAEGAEARLTVTGTSDPGNSDGYDYYSADEGGMVVLSSIGHDSVFDYAFGGGTLALVDPAANITGPIESGGIGGISVGDVLELPGSAVSNVSFGTQTLSVTTTSGTYAFNVSYQGSVNSFSTSRDASTGLVAITFTSVSTAPDVFSDNVATASDAFLWSNAGNWSQGSTPANGAIVSLAGSGDDDIGSLTLNELTTGGKVVTVDGSLLSVSALVTDAKSGVAVDSDIAGGSSTVSVILGTVTGSGALFVADGAHASLEIRAGSEPDEIYQAEAGGRITLESLSSGSKIGFVGDSTLALVLPGSVTSAELFELAVGDVLELPGTAVSGGVFGANSFDITTSSGIYDFSNVTFSGSVGSFTAGFDAATGLEAITFAAPPPPFAFQDKSKYDGAEPLNGVYFWSDAGNWVAGIVPGDGATVTETVANGIDDIDNLSLASFILGSGDQFSLLGEQLTLGDVSNAGVITAQGGVLDDGNTVTVDGVVAGGSGLYIADGSGGVLIDNVPINAGELLADAGGLLEINVAPGAAALNYDTSFFGYFNGPATMAFSHPGATIATALDNVTREDVLELPGTAVSAVQFGTASLTISTNAGTTVFTDVSYDGSVTGYTASHDSTTGLEAITFAGAGDANVDVFNGSVDRADFPTLTGELWSTDENWESKVPRNGDAVQLATTGYIAYNGSGVAYPDAAVDDIANLSLSSLSILSGTNVLIAAPLTVGSLSVATGTNAWDQSDFIVDGTTVNDGSISADPTTITFDGPVLGTGSITISAGSEITFKGSVAATETIFNSGTLVADDPAAFQGKVTGTGTEVGLCYLRGTRILTPDGEVAIEELAIGDRVITRLGGIQPIKWIGRQSFDRRFVRNNSNLMPVRIDAGALGDGLPRRCLTVSPGHSMLIDGRLILASHLINGVTIRQAEVPEQLHYYQLEFQAHDCVAAEGAWSESYADAQGLRAKFHNAAEFARLYPGHNAPARPMLCAERPRSGAGLEAALRPIVARAQQMIRPARLRGWIDAIENGRCVTGWAQDMDHPECPVLLHITMGDEIIGTVLACDARGDLREAGIGNGQCSFSFELPAPIAQDAVHRLLVRRASDGACLPKSHAYLHAPRRGLTSRAA